MVVIYACIYHGDYYAFEYNWEAADANTGWDMIQAIGVDGNNPNDTNLNYEYTDWGWGITVDALHYGGNSEYVGSDPPYPSWVYYLSDNTTRYFRDTASVGAADRALTDRSWDGWSWQGDGWGTGPAPMPEPGSMTLLAVGGAMLLRRRR